MLKAFTQFTALSFIAVSLLAMPAVASEEKPSIPMVSGGVGDDDYDMLQNSKDHYNTRILFTETNGAYLSDVDVTITTAKGTEIAHTVTQGPVLMVQLKPGSYGIKASVSGYAKEQKFAVTGKGRTNVHVGFPLKDNID